MNRGFVGGLMASLAVVAGCTVAGGGPDQSALNARLPTGVTLLESDQERCAGDVQIEESSSGTGLVLQRGQNATFRVRVDDDEEADVEWTCIGQASSDSEEIDCPTSTSHLRVTRAGSGDDLLLECYG